MGVTLQGRTSVPKKQRGHVMPRAPQIDLDGPGRLRTAHVLALFSISHSTLYSRIREGTLPKWDGTDGNRNYWNTSTIREALAAKSDGL